MQSISEADPYKIKRMTIGPGMMLLVVLVLLGAFFRLYHLDHKEFWHDEALSAITVSGLTYDWRAVFQNGQSVKAGDLLTYQKPCANWNFENSLESLARPALQHAPLFYLLLFIWVRCVGFSVFSMRLLPALISLLQMPAIYWLSMELCPLPFIAILATALLALSPVQVSYAQEVREYSLLSLATLLVCAAFLQAVRVGNLKAWTLYCLCLIFGFCTSLLVSFLAAAHCAYLMLNRDVNRPKSFHCFVLSLLSATIASLPWLYLYLKHFSLAAIATSYLSIPFPLQELAKCWCGNFASALFDPGQYRQPLVQVFITLILAVEIYSLIFLWQRRKRAAMFLGLMLGLSTLPFVVPDLMFSGFRSAAVRYQLPAMIALLVSVAYAIYFGLRSKFALKQKFWTLVAVFIFAGEIISCTASSQATTWKAKNLERQELTKIARVLNKEVGEPILISDLKDSENPVQLLSLSHLLRPEVKLMCFEVTEIPPMPVGAEHFFLFNVSEQLKSYLNNRFVLTSVDGMDYLMRADLSAANTTDALSRNGEKPASKREPN